jgi:flavodoxin I
MSKIAVVYYSTTGNTQAMAEAVWEGAKKAGAQADLIEASSFDPSTAGNYDAFAFGCPAMGAEQLDDTVFEPMFTAAEGSLNGKKTGLFGSYGWGDGQWMRDWADRVRGDGADLVQDGIIANYAPDETALEQCRDLGAALAA